MSILMIKPYLGENTVTQKYNLFSRHVAKPENERKSFHISGVDVQQLKKLLKLLHLIPGQMPHRLAETLRIERITAKKRNLRCVLCMYISSNIKSIFFGQVHIPCVCFSENLHNQVLLAQMFVQRPIQAFTLEDIRSGVFYQGKEIGSQMGMNYWLRTVLP